MRANTLVRVPPGQNSSWKLHQIPGWVLVSELPIGRIARDNKCRNTRRVILQLIKKEKKKYAAVIRVELFRSSVHPGRTQMAEGFCHPHTDLHNRVPCFLPVVKLVGPQFALTTFELAPRNGKLHRREVAVVIVDAKSASRAFAPLGSIHEAKRAPTSIWCLFRNCHR